MMFQTKNDTAMTSTGATASITSLAKNTLIDPWLPELVLVSMKQSTERNCVVASDTGLVTEKNWASYGGHSKSNEAMIVNSWKWFISTLI
jgi:hypothetical protein